MSAILRQLRREAEAWPGVRDRLREAAEALPLGQGGKLSAEVWGRPRRGTPTLQRGPASSKEDDRGSMEQIRRDILKKLNRRLPAAAGNNPPSGGAGAFGGDSLPGAGHGGAGLDGPGSLS